MERVSYSIDYLDAEGENFSILRAWIILLNKLVKLNLEALASPPDEGTGKGLCKG